DRFAGGQILAGQAGIIRAVSVGAEDRLPAPRAAETAEPARPLPRPATAKTGRPAASPHLLHLLNTLFLARVKNLIKLGVDFLLDGRQLAPLLGGQFQRDLRRERHELSGRGESKGIAAPPLPELLLLFLIQERLQLPNDIFLEVIE